ncbi:hypothetical protein [Bosea sp. BH3]|uniref:hypothetical protein n=1 Tax=Bosea sp. BH3 TaxID=2871701 RepID=UPI0021CB5477|nr:hypothetical protein [Bosea sp. BH3]MCU4178628.1 hypothetical protein [Bosea sp. BH3]
MTNSNPREPAPPASLRGLLLDPTVRAVIDELAALRLHQPGIADYAHFARNPPSVVAMVDRARHHAAEVARLIALVQNTDRAAVHLQLSGLYALALLNATATAAVALMPARTGADRHARRQHGAAFLAALDNPEENELRHAGAIAFGRNGVDAAVIAQDAIAFAGRGRGAPPQPSRATLHVIEEQATLHHWLKQTVDLTTLLDEARRHAKMASRLAMSLDQDELSSRDRDAIAAAFEGALLQHAIVLAQIALSQAEVDTDLVLDAAHTTVTNRPQLQAGLLIAIAMGQNLRTMIAANPV